jgi:hypothetical protein
MAYGSFNKEIVHDDLCAHVADKAQDDATFTDLSRTVYAKSMSDDARSEHERG